MNRSMLAFLFAAVMVSYFIFGADYLPADLRDYDRVPDFFDDRGGRALVSEAIDIQVLDDKLLAIVEGESILEETLKLDEEVLSKKTRGLVGLVVTTDRLLAVSTFTSNWIDEPLKLKEVDDKRPQAFISDFLILVVTVDRLLGFDSGGNNWVTADIPLYDRVIRAEIDRRVAVVVTTERAFGFAVDNAFFDPIKFRKGEEILSVQTSPFNINILTNRRLLVFKAATGVWQELDKDLY